MDITNKNIDGGKPFDWGRTSAEYAKYRDIYPPEFYKEILNLGLCTTGQKILDIGTGTGVIPRNMYRYGAEWTGIDISEEQIEQAKMLSSGMDINYRVSAAENAGFKDNSFDVITACQCFWYFDHERLSSEFLRILKPGGCILAMCMDWLPYEDEIAGASEALVLKYNPDWSGAGETIHPIHIPECYGKNFRLTYHREYPLKVHFTREGWNGRMKSCRGIGASLSNSKISEWETEHMKLLSQFPEEFDILHYAAIAKLETVK